MSEVTVKYRTSRDICQCCNQKLPNPIISDIRNFSFSKDIFLEWLSLEEWEVTLSSEDELTEIIEEFVHETICFFATSSDTKILVENNEYEKIKRFILEEVTL